MYRLLLALTAALTALAVLPGCSGDGGPLRRGDTVTPAFAADIDWTAGERGELYVRLRAKNQDGSAARYLGFAGYANDKHPIATITFYHGDQPQPPIDVALSERC
jgi:hypothetical protein